MHFQIIDLRDRMDENQARWEQEQAYEQDLRDYQAGNFHDPIAEEVERTGQLPGAAGPEHGADYHLKAR